MKKYNTTYLLSEQDIIESGINDDKETAMRLVKESFISAYQKRGIFPKKITLSENSHNGYVNIMPCIVGSDNETIHSIKLFGANEHNLSIGLPSASAILTLFDENTKRIKCIMDASLITTIRTAAVATLGASVLLSQKPANVILIGAGITMQLMVDYLSDMLKQSKIHVYSRGTSKFTTAQFFRHSLGLDAIAVESIDEMVPYADFIIGCIPNLNAPVIPKDIALKKGCTFFNMGLIDCAPESLLQMDRIIVDDWECTKARGDTPHVHAWQNGWIKDNNIELIAPILCGEKHGRDSEQENIYFSPVGLASHDAVFANYIYQTALSKGLGSEFLFNNGPDNC
ncbi:MAG: hypothetical protein ACRC5A_00015 [Enterobacteriaceae bacterium]